MIVSFYSYKGGVGRTQLCANVAAYFCHYKKKRVLVWDWDYEAPGLHYFFGKKNSDITKEGTLELLEGYMSFMRRSKEKVQVTDLKYITKENITSLYEGNIECIDLMAAGVYDNNFSFRATNFDWFEFYSMLDGVNYIEQLKEHIKLLNYDYILIDSRTGISDYSGICNIQLPDVNVMVIAATMQNFEGSKSIIEKIQNAEYLKIFKREAKIFPILSRLDSGSLQYNDWVIRFKEYFSDNIRKLDKAFDQEFLSEIFTDVYYRDTFLPYMPAISAGENILFGASTEKISDEIKRPFKNIAEYLDNLNNYKTLDFYKGIGERDWLKYAENANDPRKAAIAYTQVAIKQSNSDAMIEFCEKAIFNDNNYYLAYYYSAIAESTKGNNFKAITYLQQAVNLKPDYIDAYYMLGTEHLNIGKIDLSKEYFQKTIELNPNHTDAIVKLEDIKFGNINYNVQKLKEDEFINEYVNTVITKQIEQTKYETDTIVQDAKKKIKRNNIKAFLIIFFVAIIVIFISYFSLTKKSAFYPNNYVIVDSTGFYNVYSDSITNEIKTKGTSDTSFQQSTAEEVKKLNRVYDSLSNKYFWVYLGQPSKKDWYVKNFEFDNIESIEKNFTATTDVYKRDVQPDRKQDSTWKLGKVIGVVQEGQTITIEKVEIVAGANYWVLARENNSDFWVVQLDSDKKLENILLSCKNFNKKGLSNLRIVQKGIYYYIISQSFDSEYDASKYKQVHEKRMGPDIVVIKLSDICKDLAYKKPYFVCKEESGL